MNAVKNSIDDAVVINESDGTGTGTVAAYLTEKAKVQSIRPLKSDASCK